MEGFGSRPLVRSVLLFVRYIRHPNLLTLHMCHGRPLGLKARQTVAHFYCSRFMRSFLEDRAEKGQTFPICKEVRPTLSPSSFASLRSPPVLEGARGRVGNVQRWLGPAQVGNEDPKKALI